MQTHANRPIQPHCGSAVHRALKQEDKPKADFQIIKSGAHTASLRQLQECADNSSVTQELVQLKTMISNSARSEYMELLQTMVDESSRQQVQGAIDSEVNAGMQLTQTKPNFGQLHQDDPARSKGLVAKQGGDNTHLIQAVFQLARGVKNNGKSTGGGRARKPSDINGRGKPQAEKNHRNTIAKPKRKKKRQQPLYRQRPATPAPNDELVINPELPVNNESEVILEEVEINEVLPTEEQINNHDSSISQEENSQHSELTISDTNSESENEEDYREHVYVGRTIGDGANLLGVLGSEKENTFLVIVGGAGVIASGLQLLITASRSTSNAGTLEREALGTIAMGLVNLASGLSGVCSGFITQEDNSDTAGLVSTATWAGVEFLSILTQIDQLISDPDVNKLKAIMSIIASLLKCVGATLSAFENESGNWIALVGAVIGALHGIIKLGYKAKTYFCDDSDEDSSDDELSVYSAEDMV